MAGGNLSRGRQPGGPGAAAASGLDRGQRQLLHVADRQVGRRANGAAADALAFLRGAPGPLAARAPGLPRFGARSKFAGCPGRTPAEATRLFSLVDPDAGSCRHQSLRVRRTLPSRSAKAACGATPDSPPPADGDGIAVPGGRGHPRAGGAERGWLVALPAPLRMLLVAGMGLPAHRGGPAGRGRDARRAPAVAVPVLLPLLVLWLIARWLARWGFDDARLFAERARSLSGGLSPPVSLAWLGGAVFLWLLVETMRQLQGERQRAGWPLSDDLAAPLAGAAARAERIIELVRPIFPRGWHLWWITGIVVVPFLHLLPRMQPIAEGRSYGIAALVGAAVVSALSLVAVFRMLRVWWCVRRLLISTARAGLLEGVERVAPAVGWKPLQLLGYQPTVGVVTQSVVQLQRLIRLQLVPRRYDPDSLQWILRQTFRGASEGSLGVEVEARQGPNRRFEEACLDLQDQASWPTISDFLAVRLIAYLRYVFGQLRFSVLEATFTGLPLMMAAATYAFQPKRLATLFLWTTLTASSAVMLSALVQMDRDPVLSAMAAASPAR